MLSKKLNLVDKILDTAISKGNVFANFSIYFPDGKTKKVGSGKPEFEVFIKSKKVYSEVLKKGDLGIGEQFMLGNIEIKGDLRKALLTAASLKIDPAEQNFVNNLTSKVVAKLQSNTRHVALKNVAHHYDLGNDFYQKWLDKTMTYSCAYFKNINDSIDKAQEQKLEHICRKLQLKKHCLY